MALSTKTRQIEYPGSDGKPMGETECHKLAIIRIFDILRRHFAQEPVYVTADLLLFYVEGNPKKFVVPDVFVVKEAPKSQHRRNYKIWEEGRVPNVVFEVTSPSTRKVDQVTKPALYRDLGVREYFLFDPLGEYLKEPLIGYRLVEGQYQRILGDGRNGLVSEELGLSIVLKDQLEFYDVKTGERLMDYNEYSELQKLRALQAVALAEQVSARAEEAQIRVKQEAARAEAERTRSLQLAAQVDELQAELARLRAQQH